MLSSIVCRFFCKLADLLPHKSIRMDHKQAMPKDSYENNRDR